MTHYQERIARAQQRIIDQQKEKEEREGLRAAAILKRAVKLSGRSFNSSESAEEWLLDNIKFDERHECEVKSLGNHGQRVDFGNFWLQGEIVNFSAHWFDPPDTQVDHERFVDDDAKVIQLYYVVGETDYNRQ